MANDTLRSSLTSGDLLAVRHLGWSAGTQSIIENISFSVSKGEFVGLLGPNGAGKSSLLRCIYRYLTPSKGQIYFQGKDSQQYSQREYAAKVAVVLQDSPSHFNLSVYDVVSLGLLPKTSVWHRTSAQEHQQVLQAIEKVALQDKKHQPFELLSGGEKQRALIARAIVQQPELLIMDEPTSHLDVKYQIQIIELAKSLGITVLASFHDLNLASALCDRLLVINHGRLVANGLPSEVLDKSLLADVFGVCTDITPHPQHQAPHITYYYGYTESAVTEQADNSQEQESE